jgi:hypothetical protein
MTQAQVLADLMDHAHAFTLEHVGRLREKDLHHRFVVENQELNSPYWIVAHLAVSQNWLILRGTGGPFQKFSWAKLFTLGATPPPPAECPPFEEILSTYQAIHDLSMAHVGALSDGSLGAPHQAMMKLGGGDDVRAVIKHHIRHESSHNGQLGWLCKLHGLPTI